MGSQTAFFLNLALILIVRKIRKCIIR